jgi:hypothetical protein
MMSEVFSSSFLDLTDVPDGLSDGDDNTQLSESEVDSMIADNGYGMASDLFSRLFVDLIDIPAGLEDGDDDSLNAIECADGVGIVWSEASSEWVCGSSDDSASYSTGFTSVATGESLTFTTSTGSPASDIKALIADGDGYVSFVAGTPFEQCEDCGTGADGAWIVSGVSSASLAGGTYNFTDFTLPEGVHLDITGTSPLIIHATGTATINGTIDARGENGATGSEGGAGGDGGPGGGDGTDSAGYGGCIGGSDGTNDASWDLASLTDVTTITGGTGGTGNRCNSSSYRGGGGGGGGAVAVVAAQIRIGGSILAQGGSRGRSGSYASGAGGGGSVWLRASHVVVTGSISVGGHGGRSRIDAHRIEDDSIDSRTQGTTDGLPPALHVYQSIGGEVSFDNNSLDTVSADLRAL